MKVELLPTDIYLTVKEVCAYVQKTPQCVGVHRRRGWLVESPGKRFRLDHFCKYLARKYPRLPRPSVESLDEWRAQQRKEEEA